MTKHAVAIFILLAAAAQSERPSGADDFEREKLGETWTLHSGNPGIVKGDLAVLSKGLCIVSWKGHPAAADQFSEAELSAELASDSVQQVFVRRRASDGARYGFHWNPRESRWEIKLDGVPTAQTRILGSNREAKPPAAGDILRLEIRGRALRGLHQGKEVIAATDDGESAIDTGAPGLTFFTRGTAFPVRVFSAWKGGLLDDDNKK